MEQTYQLQDQLNEQNQIIAWYKNMVQVLVSQIKKLKEERIVKRKILQQQQEIVDDGEMPDKIQKLIQDIKVVVNQEHSSDMIDIGTEQVSLS